MQVVGKVVSFNVCQIVLCCLSLQTLQRFVYLSLPAFFFQFFNGFLALCAVIRQFPYRNILIVVANLYAKITAAAVDNQILAALVVNVQFDEMVASAKRADGTQKIILVFKVCNEIHVELCNCLVVDIETRWYLLIHDTV